MNLLIVDDEPWARELLTRSLVWERYGLKLIGTAANGEEALKLCTGSPVSLLISDIRMPLVDGLELCRRVGKLEQKPEIILVSGYDDFTYAKQAVRYGVVDYVLKPVEPEELEQAVTSALARIREKRSTEKRIRDLERKLRKLLPRKEETRAESKPETDFSDPRIARIVDALNAGSLHFPTLREAAGMVYVSPQHLSLLFRQQTGLSYSEYLTRLRLDRACRLLENPDLTIREIAELSGFADSDYFSRFFKQNTGVRPGEYRRRI